MSNDSASNSNPEKRPTSSKVGRPNKRKRRTPGEMHRTAIYMTGEVLNALTEQAELEGNSNSALNSDLLELLLLSPVGQRLREVTRKIDRRTITQQLNELLTVLLVSPIGQKIQKSADTNQVSLAVEVERSLGLFKEEFSTKALVDLAKELGKSPAQIIAEIIDVIVTPPLSKKLQTSADYNGRTLAKEIEKNLVLFKERIPYDKILQLAEATQRTPEDMFARLALLGLETYEQRNLVNGE